MKLLKEDEYSNLLRLASLGTLLIKEQYWFSEYKFLRPIFRYFTGLDMCGVSEARDSFKELLLKDYISKKDHEVILAQVMLLRNTSNKFPDTETYKTMRSKLDEALKTLDEFKLANEKIGKKILNGDEK